MAVIVATRMKVDRLRHLPGFLFASLRVGFQAVTTPGYRRGRLRAEAGGAFWTLTVWESGRPMAGFRDSGVHARVAPKLAGWASEAVFAVWSATTDELPGWDAVSEHVAAEPNVPPLDRPGPGHGRPAAFRARGPALDLTLPARREVLRDGREHRPRWRRAAGRIPLP